jgi:hypothetical protein
MGYLAAVKRLLSLNEWFKEFGKHRPCDPWSGIPNPQDCHSFSQHIFELQRYCPAVGSELGGIVQQVAYDLCHPSFITVDQKRIGTSCYIESDPSVLAYEPVIFARPTYHRDQIEPNSLRPELPAGDTCDV